MNIEARAPGSPVIVVGTHRDMIAEGRGGGGEEEVSFFFSPDHFSSVRKNMRQHISEIITKPGNTALTLREHCVYFACIAIEYLCQLCVNY